MLSYNKSNIPLAKNLRKNMTRQEAHLWYDFLCKYPIRFQRQKSIGNYIVDFYCAKARLALELDGIQHYEETAILKDNIRTEQLEKYNITVIRIPNKAIDKHFANVCEYIDEIVMERI